MLPPLREIIFGVLVASFLLYESKGLVELLRKIRNTLDYGHFNTNNSVTPYTF